MYKQIRNRNRKNRTKKLTALTNIFLGASIYHHLKHCSAEVAALAYIYIYKILPEIDNRIHEFMNHWNPYLVWEFHEKKPITYNLRIQNFCKLPTIKTLGFGRESLSVIGSFLWKILDESIKREATLYISCFRKSLKEWTAE